MDIKWITPVRGSAGMVSSHDTAIRISISKNASGDAQSCITLYRDFMRDMRIQSGDRVIVGDAGDYIVKRTQSGGYALRPSGASGEDRNKKLGTYTTSVVKFSSNLVRCNALFRKEDLTVNEEGVIFIPKNPKQEQ